MHKNTSPNQVVRLIREAVNNAALGTAQRLAGLHWNSKDLPHLEGAHRALCSVVKELDVLLERGGFECVACEERRAPRAICRVCGKTAGESPRLCDACAFAALKLRPPPAPVAKARRTLDQAPSTYTPLDVHHLLNALDNERAGDSAYGDAAEIRDALIAAIPSLLSKAEKADAFAAVVEKASDEFPGAGLAKALAAYRSA